jgi:hypothetical protein
LEKDFAISQHGSSPETKAYSPAYINFSTAVAAQWNLTADAAVEVDVTPRKHSPAKQAKSLLNFLKMLMREFGG